MHTGNGSDSISRCAGIGEDWPAGARRLQALQLLGSECDISGPAFPGIEALLADIIANCSTASGL